MVDVIAFDADDTLWHDLRMFRATEDQFVELLSAYHTPEWIRERLFATEVKNLEHFGYGVKGYVLSMIETALDLTESRIGGAELRQIVDWGHEMLRQPVQLLDGVRETVEALAGRYRLMLLTKGDLFDQESKLARSGLGDFFDAVEIVSAKNASVYRAIMSRHGVAPDRFVMVGNSLRSDVLPALEAGGRAVHIPYESTWAHEHLDDADLAGKDFIALERIAQLPEWLANGSHHSNSPR